MDMKEVLTKEVEEISLSKAEISRLNKIAKNFTSSLKSYGIKSYVGGSLAKGTLIKKEGLQDIDIFAVFDSSKDIVKLDKVLKKIKLPGKLKKIHGSRDYFQIICDDILPGHIPRGHENFLQGKNLQASVLLEVVPVVKNIKPELAENVTDVSLSHVKFVLNEIKKNPEIADEIKLAKAFCRANKCYGAEGYIRGFSGYSLEVLVIYFGGFVKFLKGINKKKVIDPSKHFKNKRETMYEINASKLNSPVVLIDPTYKYRNATAGLGLETFDKFTNIAKEFLKSPSLEYFKIKEINVSEMKKFAIKKKARFIEINLGTDRQEGDIAGTKMKKILDFFIRELTRKQQIVLRKEYDYSGGKKAKGYLVVKEKKEIELQGPPIALKNAVESFKKAKGKNVLKKKGYYWYKEKSDVNEVYKLIKKVEKEMGAILKII